MQPLTQPRPWRPFTFNVGAWSCTSGNWKTLLRLDVLRCRSPQMIHKEVLLHLMAYNLVRTLMQQAARGHHVDLSRISFKGTLDTVQPFAAFLQASGASPRRRAA